MAIGIFLFEEEKEHYMPCSGTAKSLLSVIGGLAGRILFPHNRQRLLTNQYLSAVILGAVIFVLARGVCVDVLTMRSGSLEPKVHKGQKVLISYLSFGIHIPFYPYPLVQWGVPKAGELVIVLGPGGNPYMREVLNTRESEVLVNVDGWVPRKTLLAKGWPI